jgi:hypothetical protein
MLYTVVNQFERSNQESWKKYMQSSGLIQIEDFCSLDSMLNDSVFEPQSEKDWKNSAIDEGRVNFIKDYEYAKSISLKYPGSKIFGLVIAPKESEIADGNKLLGYVILDGYLSNSVLTNCGGYPLGFDFRS